MNKLNNEFILSNNIIDAEEKYSLFDDKIDDIQIYPLIRMGLYYKLTENLNYYSPQPKKNFKISTKNIISLIKHLYNNNDLKKIKTKFIGVIEHPRRLDDMDFDIYTDFLKDILSITTISNPHYGNQILGKINNKIVYYDYYLLKKKIINLFYFNKKINNYAKKLSKIISQEFDSNNNYENFLVKLIKDRYLSCNIAYSFLKKTNIKSLIIVNSYGFNHFVWAAKKLNIKTIELQHGIISNLHLGYHYPSSKIDSIDCFPEYLLTFGNFWNELAKIPIIKNRIVANGYFFFNKQVAKYQNLNIQKMNKILVISQSTIGERLSKEIIKMAKELKDFEIIYKPHPKEIITQTSYLQELSKFKNITIANNTSLYALFAECEWQIGVFSTALFEGLGFGLKTIILKLPGWQNLKSLDNLKGVNFISDFKQAIKIIKNETEQPELNYFFSDNALEKHKSFFQKL